MKLVECRLAAPAPFFVKVYNDSHVQPRCLTPALSEASIEALSRGSRDRGFTRLSIYRRIALKELVRTNDMVRLSFLRALLSDAGIEHVVLDIHMSITEGNANFIAPRLMVDSEDYARARRLLDEAGIDAT
jgi:hypothetical protein